MNTTIREQLALHAYRLWQRDLVIAQLAVVIAAQNWYAAGTELSDELEESQETKAWVLSRMVEALARVEARGSASSP